MAEPARSGLAGLSKRVVAVIAFLLGALVAIPVQRFGPVLLDQLLARAGQDLIMGDSTWPTIEPPCDYVVTAGIGNAESPLTFPMTTDVIDHDYALGLDDVVPHRHAELLLKFSGMEETPVLIERIEPVVYRSEETTPLWSLDETVPACGGFTERKATLTLTGGEGFLIDEGENTEVSDELNEFGSYFTVSAGDQTGMRVFVGVCDSRYYEFGLDVTYSLRGVQYHYEMGSEGEPFKIVGGDASAYFLSTATPGPGQVSPVPKPPQPLVTEGMC